MISKESDIKQVENSIEQKRYDEAFARIKILKNNHKDIPEVYSLEGLIYLMLNEIDHAKQILEIGYQHFNKDHDILFELGMVYEILDNKYVALNYYLEAEKYVKSSASKRNIEKVIDGLVFELVEKVINREENSAKLLMFLDTHDLLLDKYLKELAVNMFSEQIIIETIRGCNLKCPFCPLQVDSGVKDYGLMKDETFDKICDEIVSIQSIKSFILHNLGEPLLDKGIFDKVRRIKEIRNDAEVIMDSNLSIDFDAFDMVKSGLSILNVALDGATQKTYSHYRKNGSLDKVLSNIVRISTAKRILNAQTPIIEAKLVLFKHIIDEINVIYNFAVTAGANDFKWQKAIFRNETDENPKEWIPEQQELSRYNVRELYENNELIHIKEYKPAEKYCSGILTSIPAVIDYKGNVYPCCYNCTREEYAMGNINESSFKEIWLSDKYISFRVNVLKNRSIYDACCECYRPTNQF